MIGLGVEMFQPLMVSDPYGYAQGAWLETMREQVEKDLDTAQQAFERCAAGVDHEWRRLVDLPRLGTGSPSQSISTNACSGR